MQTSTKVLRRACAVLVAVGWWAAPAAGGDDPRNIRSGSVIPDEGYCDQPYLLVTKDGNWLCTLTTGRGKEGDKGQHVVATTSTDRGQTWSPLVDIEPADGLEASWVVPLVVPGGRVYAFYTYNGDRIGQLPGSPKKVRADMLGWLVYRYSDDHGKTWSAQRYRLPMRLTACDRGNQWQGKVQVFWGIDKPKLSDGTVYFAFTKLGRYMLEDGEGWMYRSASLLAESDPEKIRWELLPQGDHGIRASEFGSIQEEHNLVPLGDGRLYCVYRTTTGYPCHAYSNDGGNTWTRPEHMTYTPGGRKVKNPRACPKLWRAANGKFLFWFHNHSGQSFDGRNPAWIIGGDQQDGRIHWSQPEILLYDSAPATRISYPDLIEQDGRCWVTETQKTVARVHEIDCSLLEGLWNQGRQKTIARNGLLLDLGPEDLRAKQVRLPGNLDLVATGGMTLECWIAWKDLAAGQVILDARDAAGKGFALTTTPQATVRLELSDGTNKAAWDGDAGLLAPGKTTHLVAIVDAGPQIIGFVIDGQFCDGGPQRQYGWTRYAAPIGDVGGAGRLLLAPSLRGQLKRVRLYGRALRTSEAVAHFHAGP